MKIQLLMHAEVYQSNNPEQIHSIEPRMVSFEMEDVQRIISEHQELDGVNKNFARFPLNYNYIAPRDEASDNGFSGELIAMFEDGSIDLYAFNGHDTVSITLPKGALMLEKALSSANLLGIESDLDALFLGNTLDHSKSIANHLISGSVDLFKNLTFSNVIWRDSKNNLVGAPENMSGLVVDSKGAFHRVIDGKIQGRNSEYHSESSLVL